MSTTVVSSSHKRICHTIYNYNVNHSGIYINLLTPFYKSIVLLKKQRKERNGNTFKAPRDISWVKMETPSSGKAAYRKTIDQPNIHLPKCTESSYSDNLNDKNGSQDVKTTNLNNEIRDVSKILIYVLIHLYVSF